MDHFDDVLIFPILDPEIGRFNMTRAFRRVTCIDNFDTGFIIFVDIGGTSRGKLKTMKDMTEKKACFCSGNGGIKFN